MPEAKQFLDVKAGDSLKNLGSKGMWPDWVTKDIKQAYKFRRLKITELQNNLKDLLSSKTLNSTAKRKIHDLVREIKTVVETDPTIANYRFDKKGKLVSDLKGFYNTSRPIEAHHIKGLDKFYQPLKQLDDIDLFNLHTKSAKKGFYFGNHPKNRLALDRSLHSGRTRQAVPSFESIHGRINFQDLSPDEFDEYINRIVSNQPTDDIGTFGGPEGKNRSRMEVPSDDFWEYGMTPEAESKLFDMADADHTLANEFKGKGTKPVLFEGKPKSGFLKQFINNHPDASKWPKGTIEAIQNQDIDELIKVNKQIETQRIQDFDSKLAGEFGTKPKMDPVKGPFPSWENQGIPRTQPDEFYDIAKKSGIQMSSEVSDAVKTAGKLAKLSRVASGIGGAESATMLVGGSGLEKVAGGVGLAMQTPAAQKQIAKLMTKQGIKMIPGVSLVSGIAQGVGYGLSGQFGKAALSVGGGVIGELGPAGDVVQAMIDLGLTVDDIKQAKANKPDSDIDMTEGGKVKKYETGVLHSATGQGDQAFDNVVDRIKSRDNPLQGFDTGPSTTFRQLLKSGT